jgi:hypothetical protein
LYEHDLDAPSPSAGRSRSIRLQELSRHPNSFQILVFSDHKPVALENIAPVISWPSSRVRKSGDEYAIEIDYFGLR